MKKRSGITTILIVFLVSMIAMLIIVAWQSRLLLIVHRSQGLADVLISLYNSETEINDVIGRFLGGYPIPAAGTKTLADGTVVETVVENIGDTEKLGITTKRPFATNQMQVSRIKSILPSEGYNKVEIILGVDCTTSMEEKANPDCTGGGCNTRISMAKKAMLSFVDQVTALPADEQPKFFIGIESFKISQQWVSPPVNDMVSLSQTINSEFGNHVFNSNACNIANPSIPGVGETSLGGAVVFGSDYLRTTAQEKTKQIYVLLTDGLPNVSLTDNRCDTTDCRDVDGGVCSELALNYLTCGLASTETEWKPGYSGLRDKLVDVYAVSVMAKPSNPSEAAAFTQTEQIFQNTNYVKQYFNSENADNLPDILKNIFEDITHDVYKITIERIVPTLGE